MVKDWCGVDRGWRVALVMSINIRRDAPARVRLRPDCPGDGSRPHHPAEDGIRVSVTAVGEPGDHGVFAPYKGGGRANVPRPVGGLGLGRHFRPDELEVNPEPA
jgi:hypothetical protein